MRDLLTEEVELNEAAHGAGSIRKNNKRLVVRTGTFNINLYFIPNSVLIDAHTEDWGKARLPTGTCSSPTLCCALKRASLAGLG